MGGGLYMGCSLKCMGVPPSSGGGCKLNRSGGLLGETEFGETVFAQGILQGAAEATSHHLQQYIYLPYNHATTSSTNELKTSGGFAGGKGGDGPFAPGNPTSTTATT